MAQSVQLVAWTQQANPKSQWRKAKIASKRGAGVGLERIEKCIFFGMPENLKC